MDMHPTPPISARQLKAGMSARYANELTRLSRTLSWATKSDLAPIRQAISEATHSPLRAIGSGGSLTAAHVLATLHKRYSGHLAAATTPLEAINQPLDPSVSAWLLTAGGSNVDILSVAKSLIAGEPRQLAVLCGRSNSPLARLCGQHPFIDLLLYAPHGGKDGFLATNSLLGFSAVLARAYAIEYRCDEDWHDAYQQLLHLVRPESPQISAWQDATQPLWQRSTTLVLHGASTHIGAIDLESKFTESALGNVQLADYRNFAHGRHHWLAKHAETSAILAFVADDDDRVAERTLNLIPPEIPQARILLPGSHTATQLASLTAALWLTHWAATARGVDPGRPGVPEFGRKIYHLRAQGRRRSRVLPPRQTAAIRRKIDVTPHHGDSTNLDLWREALDAFLLRLRNSQFNAVVFDYDGTLIDTRHRFATPTPEICTEIIRIIESNTSIGIATGRGKSVRNDLQGSLPQSLWSHVLVGYYNGAQLATLDDDATPDLSHSLDPSLEPLVDLLINHPTLSRIARQSTRPSQITLDAMSHVPNDFLWELTSEIVHEACPAGVSVVRSAHSVDVLAAGVNKLNVVNRLREATGDDRVLTIGDRGRWPGNDHKLLREPCSLSVDEVSTDPSTCWHLGLSGQRGLKVTLDYLAALIPSASHLAFAPDSFE